MWRQLIHDGCGGGLVAAATPEGNAGMVCSRCGNQWRIMVEGVAVSLPKDSEIREIRDEDGLEIR